MIIIPPGDWAAVAHSAQRAVALLGYPVDECLPDQPGGPGCGGDFHSHAMAYLVTIQEVAAHQLLHLGPPTTHVDAVRQDIRSKLVLTCGGHVGHADLLPDRDAL